MGDITEALKSVEEVYGGTKQFIDEIISRYCSPIDEVIASLENSFELSNEDIRKAIVDLSLKSYRLSDIKERSALKAECAETLRKMSYATAFNLSTGAVAVRENEATNAISEQLLAEKVYDSLSSTFKTKLDEVHRVVDALKSVLVSRISEEKLAVTQTI